MELNLQKANIVEVIENITLSTAEYVESKSRDLIFDTDTEEKIMNFDLEKMERIMLNLISNATKFTKPGDKIEVNIYDKGESILISVKDTGTGISQDNLQQIFQRFKQVGPLLSRTHEGSGIGLSMVKSLVEMHDGTISAKSKYGEGTEFIIELPVKTILEEDISEPLNKSPHQINVEKIQIEFSDIY
ncbi:Adaptive-response sensory-kinase SasA [bioreactor metagenome]|uniref:histidine kinase n=2 Tax=root TaxID=1 RepID=A0A645IBJ3_9ZZZZ